MDPDTLILLLMAVIGGLIGGGAMYARVRRDLGTRRASQVAAVTFVAMAIGWWFALYGVVVGLIAAVVAYTVARSRIGADRALLAAGGSFLAIVVGVAGLLFASLATM